MFVYLRVSSSGELYLCFFVHHDVQNKNLHYPSIVGIPEFPVDTHVLRISKQLGWVKGSTSREAAYEYLNEIVPEECKLDLHCLLVTHGKWCYNCAANGKPQFKPKEKFICPLIGIKGGIKTEKQDVKVKKEKGVKVKKEKVKTEDM